VWFQAACFYPSGTNILVREYDSVVIWDIKRGKEQFTIEGQDFVFIQYGGWHSSIILFDWIDEDGSSIQMDFRDVYMNQMFPTWILVKLWDVEDGTPKSSTLFKVIDVDVHVAQFSSDR